MRENIFCPDCNEQILQILTCKSGKIVCDICEVEFLVLSGGFSDCHGVVVFFFEGNRVCGHCLNTCSLVPMLRIAA